MNATHPSTRWRSVGAVVAGIVAVVALHVGTDQVMRVLDIFPPPDQPLQSTGLFVLALSYRLFWAVVGGYITARLAPAKPVKHAVIVGIIGSVATLPGVVFSVANPELGPLWYPVALAITAVPCCWLGGKLYERRHASA